MISQKIEIKSKIVNHLMLNGEKKTGEKILLKSLKEVQKDSKKQSKELIQLALIYTAPTFKLHRISSKNQKKRNKKAREIPAFVSNMNKRISLAIKFILKTIAKKKLNNFFLKLKEEVFFNALGKGSAIQVKNELQKQILLNKHYFSYYRWR